MEMPELFGSAYILPVIIVVVLLLVLLLILMMRRRRGETSMNTGLTEQIATPSDRSIPAQAAEEASIAAVPTNQPAEAAAQPAAAIETTAAGIDGNNIVGGSFRTWDP